MTFYVSSIHFDIFVELNKCILENIHKEIFEIFKILKNYKFIYTVIFNNLPKNYVSDKNCEGVTCQSSQSTTSKIWETERTPGLPRTACVNIPLMKYLAKIVLYFI